MKINLIIATYAGQCEKHSVNVHKPSYLKLNLHFLNRIKTRIDKITIMRPKVNPEDTVIEGYYDFSQLCIDNIRDRIEICDCENVGISYGQYFAGISRNRDCDVHFWLEDDYVVCCDYFEEILLDKSCLYGKNTHLCPFIYKNKTWNIVPYARSVEEDPSNIRLLQDKLVEYGIESLDCHIPDMMQLGLLTRESVNLIWETFGSLDNLLDFFRIPFKRIWLHQILFGYVLSLSGVDLRDTADSHLNLFYETSINTVFLCNYPEHVNTWKDREYRHEKLALPLCMPLDVLVHSNTHAADLDLMKKYASDEYAFSALFLKYANIATDWLNLSMRGLYIRELRSTDYHAGYMELMFEFTNYRYETNYDAFSHYLLSEKNSTTVYVIFSVTENRVVGAGTLFVLRKLHNHPMGQVEDFVVTEPFRNHGIGSCLLRHIVDVGLNEFQCYKVVLKSRSENIIFYEKNGFQPACTELKFVGNCNRV